MLVGGHFIENENVKLVYVECLIVWELPFGQVGKKLIIHLIETIGEICEILWPKQHLY